MTGAQRATRSEELLFERERQGVRTLTVVRGIFVLTIVATVWIIGVNLFEKIATTAIAALVLGAIGGSLLLLARRRAVGTVGLAGCVIDVAVLSALPVVCYISVGGGDLPVTVSIGASLFEDQPENPTAETLLEDARRQLQDACSQGHRQIKY